MVLRAPYSGRDGFTLMEVLVALGILATAYIALIETISGSVRLSTYGRQVTVAALLAQAKLEQAEEKLIKDGFPVDSEESTGTFEEAGYPGYHWKLEVRKVELPIADALDYLLNRGGDDSGKKKGDTKGKGLGDLLGNLGGGANAPKGPKGDPMTDALKQAGGMGGSLLGSGMLKNGVDMVSKQIETALRELQIVVEWDKGGQGKQLVVTTHVVQIPQATAAAGAQAAMTSSTNTTGLPGTTTVPAGAPTQ